MINTIPNTANHTHCQVAQSNSRSQNLPKSMTAPTHGRKESTGIQHCIRAIAGEVVNSRPAHLINICSGGQVITLKSATALILDRWWQPLGTQLTLNREALNKYK